jgi:hypothetical protein
MKYDMEDMVGTKENEGNEERAGHERVRKVEPI